MKSTLVTSILGLLVFVSCNVINPSEDIPFFVEIPAIELCTDDSCYTQSQDRGSSAHGIVDAWVFADDNLLGAFELPALVPILKSGNVKISVQGGIKSNGIIGDAKQYDFFEPYTIYVNATPGETYKLNTTVTYRTSIAIWNEDFDLQNSGIKFENYPSSDTTLTVTTDNNEVFEGLGSGKLVLDNNNNTYRGLSSTKFIFPRGQVIYAEINYKATNAFTVGIKTQYNGFESIQRALTLKPSYNENSGVYEWRKVYVDLSYAIGLETQGYPQQLFLEMKKDNGTEVELLIDNVKIIYGV
jgi:hypothetical protein